MFDWFYKRITLAAIGGIEAFFSDEDNIKQLTALTDAIVDRQMQRVYGKVGGTMKGINAAAKEEIPLANLFDKDGSLNFKAIINSFLVPRLVAGMSGGPAGEGGSPSPQSLSFKDRLAKYR